MTTGEPQYDPQGTAHVPPGEYQMDTTTSGQPLADTARQGADQVKQAASATTDKLKGTAMSQAATQKDQAADSLNTVGAAVNQAAQQLRQNNQAPIAQVAEMAASNLGQAADYLRTRSVGDLIGDVEDFANRQPALFLSGAFLVGVLGARFLKSSRSGMGPQGTSQRWRSGSRSGYLSQTGQYGNQYAPYNNVNNPGVGANVNTGGLQYGRNLPPNGTGTGAPGSTSARQPNGRYATYPSDEDIIAGETPS